jgi:hypothetical protein
MKLARTLPLNAEVRRRHAKSGISKKSKGLQGAVLPDIITTAPRNTMSCLEAALEAM